MSGWIGVDFDGTLATYAGWVDANNCGEPIAPMVDRVKGWLAEGKEVRIFTARVWPHTQPVTDQNLKQTLIALRLIASQAPIGNIRFLSAAESIEAIREWCRKHIGQTLPITCVKDYGMVQLWDDRAVQVRPNTGQVVGE